MCLGMMMFSSFVSAMDWEEDANAELLEAMDKGRNSPEREQAVLNIKKALSKGADVNIRDKFGRTPIIILLHIEGGTRKPERSTFFKQNIKPILDTYKPNLMIQDNMGHTAYSMAMYTQDKETIEAINCYIDECSKANESTGK